MTIPFTIALPNQVCLPDMQEAKLRHGALQYRKGLFTSQPSEESGEQISDLSPQERQACDIYGIRKQGGFQCGEM